MQETPPSAPASEALPAEAQGAEEPSLPGFAPSPAPERPSGYRVLARKYRPSSFADLIGQDAMVRTLRNAFANNRIPQAWMLTGVRGVGKTTTARILARGLNYQLPEGSGAPTVDLDRFGVHCAAIIEGNHIDVMEIDAASNNGVENVRQITDSVRYAPTSARYKVYIIDEVHMLSAGAFNAFLKTLEEPPPHVKFIFATTEIRKVPVTVLSRCQRFDLRRVEASTLVTHLARICDLEKVEVEDEALSLIARAAEGSVRDAMSLLDQAIAHGAGKVVAEDVRAMLGLADRARLLDLFEALMAGKAGEALAGLRELYDIGSDPTLVVADLADIAHLATRLKILPEAAKDAALSEAERVRGLSFAERLSMPILSRAWQILSRGLLEVQAAGKPIAAAEMLLIRLAYAANLPTPDEALKALPPSGTVASAKPASSLSSPSDASGAGRSYASSVPGNLSPASPATPSANASASRPVANLRIASSGSAVGGAHALRREERAPEAHLAPLARFEDVIALAHEKRDLALAYALERDVRLVTFERGRIEFEPSPGAKDDLAKTVARRLLEWTGERWLVAVSPASGARSIGERRDLERKGAVEAAKAEPLVRAILERFPGAEIVTVRDSLAAEEEMEKPEDYLETMSSELNTEGFEDDDPFEFLETVSDE
ncbi:MAG: DNA polymerase III subunit gamma/tau [Hyphomicrobiales bacterium]|nr:DNA polymerase III subunit gamma/tau [Hyphomicrobiales bacterium]